MLRAAESTRKGYVGLRRKSRIFHCQPQHVLLSMQLNQYKVKGRTLVLVAEPESIRRNIENDTPPIIPDFHGPDSAGDSTGRHVFSAA
jgi:hypothetical protein